MSELVPTEFKNKRILTTEQLAEIYGTTVDNIKVNFNNHKDNFKKGKHYFYIEGEELREFKSQVNNIYPPLINKFTSNLYLWTERGANRHCKILDTDKAWEQFDNLEETYFKVKEVKPQCIEDVLIQSLQEMKEVRLQLQEVKQANADTKQEIQDMRDTITLSPTSWRKDTTAIVNKIALNIGGYDHIKAIREESYKFLNERMGADVKTRLTNKRRRMADEGVCKSKRDKLTILDVIQDDKKLIEGYVAIIKEMAIKYGI